LDPSLLLAPCRVANFAHVGMVAIGSLACVYACILNINMSQRLRWSWIYRCNGRRLCLAVWIMHRSCSEASWVGCPMTLAFFAVWPSDFWIMHGKLLSPRDYCTWACTTCAKSASVTVSAWLCMRQGLTLTNFTPLKWRERPWRRSFLRPMHVRLTDNTCRQ
jgi:hypothetical protein